MRIPSLLPPALLLALATLIASPSASAQAVRCGDTLYGAVTLTADVVCGPGQDGLFVGDHNVRLDLNGFNIVGPYSIANPTPQATGIVSTGFDEVQIVGPGTITGFPTPFDIDRGNKHLISGIDVIAGSAPALVRNSSGSVIENNRMTTDLEIVSDPGYRATDNVIRGNTSKRGRIALSGCDTSNNLIDDNNLGGFISTRYAIVLYGGAHNNEIVNNRIELGTIELANSSNNLVANNTVKNYGYGSTHYGGVNISADNFFPVCLSNATYLISVNNVIRHNQFYSGEYGVIVGEHLFPLNPCGCYNLITGNYFQDQQLAALYFSDEAGYNDARGNSYNNVARIAVDLGYGNLWP